MSALETALGDAIAVLADMPSALITDIDGTIAPIASRPEEAAVSPVARDALRDLTRSLSLVAVLTARDEPTARSMMGIEELTYVCSYGLPVETSLSTDETLQPAKSEVLTLLDPLPCVEFEDKGLSFALHYRNCDEPDAVRERLLGILRPMSERYSGRIVEGKKVVELVPAGLPDKGTAFARLLDAHGIRGVVYLGDDLPDVEVYREIGRRRTDGLPGLGFAVVDDETEDVIRSVADVELMGIGEVEQLLLLLVGSLEGGGEG